MLEVPTSILLKFIDNIFCNSFWHLLFLNKFFNKIIYEIANLKDFNSFVFDRKI